MAPVITPQGPCLIEVNCRVMGPVLSADAFYAAFGYSQPALLAESIVDPDIFSTRLTNVTPAAKKHFAMIFLRCQATGAEMDAGVATLLCLGVSASLFRIFFNERRRELPEAV
ncbi:hypothetical protein [Pantoea sp. B65]|uniref:hypothetical protein n=1 Tax=Pantoea sp. B65 TaxID=2813359 RepID=UPI0039B65D01